MSKWVRCEKCEKVDSARRGRPGTKVGIECGDCGGSWCRACCPTGHGTRERPKARSAVTRSKPVVRMADPSYNGVRQYLTEKTYAYGDNPLGVLDDVKCVGESESGRALRMFHQELGEFYVPKGQVAEESEVWEEGHEGTLAMSHWWSFVASRS